MLRRSRRINFLLFLSFLIVTFIYNTIFLGAAREKRNEGKNLFLG